MLETPASKFAKVNTVSKQEDLYTYYIHHKLWIIYQKLKNFKIWFIMMSNMKYYIK